MLGKTQPAVSAQLKQLSDAVGVPVLLRHRYGVTLTPAGESLLTYAEACVRAMEGAEQALARLHGLNGGKLRVLASTPVAVYVLPAALAAFHAKFPAIELEMTRHSARSAIRALERGDGDIALVRGSATVSAALASNFVIATLVEDVTVLVVPPRHPFARRKLLHPKQLNGLEIVSREPGSENRMLVERVVAQANIALKVKFQTDGVDALKEAILQGFGAGFLSRLAVQREVEAGTLAAVAVQTPEFVQHIRMAYPAAGQCPPAVSRFVDILQSLYAPNRSRRIALQSTRY